MSKARHLAATAPPISPVPRIATVFPDIGSSNRSDGSAWGDIHLGPENALEALGLLGGGAFLPVHRGTFSLAMHAWDEPAETLLALGPKRGVPLVMPQLGEPVEPSQVERATPWWRAVERQPRQPGAPVETEPAAIPKNLPWAVD